MDRRHNREIHKGTKIGHTALISNNPEWELAGVYTDEGISGTNTAKRSGFLQMIQDCRDRKIDMVLTKSISRFARNTVDCLNYTRELKDLNIAVRFEKENINTLEASGEVMLTIMAALAQQESESLSANVKLGIRFRYEQGQVRVNHNRFLGYTKDSEGKLVIDEKQAAVVRRIYDDFLVKGMTPSRIKAGLEADGVPNGMGNLKWCVSNIHQILTNEKYIGDALLQKTWTVNTLEKVRRKNNGDLPQYYVEGNHEPIIDRATFAAVQQELARRADIAAGSGARRVYSDKFAFNGILYCGYCGDVYHTTGYFYKGKKTLKWRCATRIAQTVTACENRAINDEALKHMTVAAINRAMTFRKSSADRLMQAVGTGLTEAAEGKRTVIEEQLRQAQERLIDAAPRSPEAEAASADIQRLRTERDRLDKDSQGIEQRKAEIARMTETFAGIRKPLAEYDDTYVRQLLERISVYRDRVVFRFKDGREVTVEE